MKNTVLLALLVLGVAGPAHAKVEFSTVAAIVEQLQGKNEAGMQALLPQYGIGLSDGYKAGYENEAQALVRDFGNMFNYAVALDQATLVETSQSISMKCQDNNFDYVAGDAGPAADFYQAKIEAGTWDNSKAVTCYVEGSVTSSVLSADAPSKNVENAYYSVVVYENIVIQVGPVPAG